MEATRNKKRMRKFCKWCRYYPCTHTAIEAVCIKTGEIVIGAQASCEHFELGLEGATRARPST